MLKLGWFSTGRGPGSRNLLTTVNDAISSGHIDAQVEFVFTNREPGEAEGSDQYQQLVRDLGFPLICYSSRKFKRSWSGEPVEWRVAYDREVMKRLEGYSPDLSVLAGYMLICGPEMCDRYTMINLHPAAPDGPEGTWQQVIWKLIDQRADHSGVRIHLVTEELDAGPIVAFCTYPITGPDFDLLWHAVRDRATEEIKAEEGEDFSLFKAIREEGARRELPLLVEALKSIADGSIDLNRRQSTQPIDLTDNIERILG